MSPEVRALMAASLAGSLLQCMKHEDVPRRALQLADELLAQCEPKEEPEAEKDDAAEQPA